MGILRSVALGAVSISLILVFVLPALLILLALSPGLMLLDWFFDGGRT